MVQGSESEHALVQAAAKVVCHQALHSQHLEHQVHRRGSVLFHAVKRHDKSTDRVIISGRHGLPITKAKLGAIKALEKTSLEYTLIVNGYFADHYLVLCPSREVVLLASDRSCPGHCEQLCRNHRLQRHSNRLHPPVPSDALLDVPQADAAGFLFAGFGHHARTRPV